MEVKQYDRVLLKDGHTAYIVEVFGGGTDFLADIEKDGDTYTEAITRADIDSIISH